MKGSPRVKVTPDHIKSFKTSIRTIHGMFASKILYNGYFVKTFRVEPSILLPDKIQCYVELENEEVVCEYESVPIDDWNMKCEFRVVTVEIK